MEWASGFHAMYDLYQDQDSLLVKRRNNNYSPGPVIRELAEAIRTTIVPIKYPYQHDGRADKDSYPHDRNVTDDLCSLIKLCFAFIMVNFST